MPPGGSRRCCASISRPTSRSASDRPGCLQFRDATEGRMTRRPITSAALALALVTGALALGIIPFVIPFLGALAPVALAQDQQPGSSQAQAPAQQPGGDQTQAPAAQQPGGDQTQAPPQEPAGGQTQAPAQAPALARGDRALLVGIDEYQEPAFKLQGSLNDVRNMRKLLTDTLGYKPEQIMTLTDAQATRDNILKALAEWLTG